MPQSTPYHDRRTAGDALAAALEHYAVDDPIVAGLTRGGVAVAEPVARALQAPFDMLVVHKMGSPAQPELAIGAFAEGDVQVVDTILCEERGITGPRIRRLSQAHAEALNARVRHYRRALPRIPLEGRLAILVDDGLATGATAHAAIRSARRAGARRVILATPVGSRSAVDRLSAVADEVVCLDVPETFVSVGQHYAEFPQLSDEAMLGIISRDTRTEVAIPVSDAVMHGILDVPAGARLLVIFAHGSGSSRFSPRNAEVARLFNDTGIATLLLDLLTEDESAIRSHVFDIEHLADRLEGAVAWSVTAPRTQHLGVALFGASTGAAAALAVAARCPDLVRSVVSRGGRPDLARHWLPLVHAPTLLIVGGDDVDVLRLNREAFSHLRCPAKLEVVPGASHLFEEPGALAHVAALARDWLLRTSASLAA
jgi:putative phosphoribosyl transferase